MNIMNHIESRERHKFFFKASTFLCFYFEMSNKVKRVY